MAQELWSNIYKYGEWGFVRVDRLPDGLFRVHAKDIGPGFEHGVSKSMQAGFSTGGTPGVGYPTQTIHKSQNILVANGAERYQDGVDLGVIYSLDKMSAYGNVLFADEAMEGVEVIAFDGTDRSEEKKASAEVSV